MDRKRHGIQAAAALIQNANIKGFLTGRIYQGPVKNVCVPGLNCYSCPGAVGACPIGSLQSFLGARTFRFPYYVLGLMIFFGALLGRLICGFLCPFGLLQDLLDKINITVKHPKFKWDKPLRYLKYAVLLVMVVVLPLTVKLTPFFCKYLCPAGTLSGVLLALADSSVGALLGSRFAFKAAILALVLISAVIIYRPFCKYLCPLGAFYGLFNRVSVVRIGLDRDLCTGCGACSAVCGMGVDPSRDPDSCECIRCGRCTAVCPEGALEWKAAGRTVKTSRSGSDRRNEI